MSTIIDGNASLTAVGAQWGTAMAEPEDGTSLLSTPSLTAVLPLGDVGAALAALLLKCNQANHKAALAERDISAAREDNEQQQQLHALRERADSILLSGLTTGLMKAGSGVLSYAAAGSEARATEQGWKTDALSRSSQTAAKGGCIDEAERLENLANLSQTQSLAAKSMQRNLELTGKLTGAAADATRACGESAQAERDTEAKECEQAASHAARRVADANDKVAQLDKFANEVIDFVREFERTMDTARSAALHGA